MSNIHVPPQLQNMTNLPSNMAKMLENVGELQNAAFAAVQSISASATKKADNLSADTPTITQQPTSSAPTLSKPSISPRAMMIALMGLQTKAHNEAVSIGLEGAKTDQVAVAEQNEALANDALGYYETMRQQEDVNGAMAIANVFISALFLVGAIAMTVATGGASTLALVAGVAACVAAAATLANSIMSVPAIQESMSDKASQIISIVLTSITIAAGILGAVCGGFAVKAGATAAKGAAKATINHADEVVDVAKGAKKAGKAAKAASHADDVADVADIAKKVDIDVQKPDAINKKPKNTMDKDIDAKDKKDREHDLLQDEAKANEEIQNLRTRNQYFAHTSQLVTLATGIISASLDVASSSINFKATKAEDRHQSIQREIDEAQAEFDSDLSDLNVILESYASMIQSTADMIQKTAEGAQSAASISA